jgi:linoleoyl-CoA desaturase
MKEVKFKTGDEVQFFQTLRNRVEAYFQENNLSKNANAAMVVKTVVLISAYVLPFVAILVIPMSFGVAILLWLLMGWAMAGIGMSIMHDANHGAYSSSNRINKIIGRTLHAIGGTAENWKVQHNVLHHTYTNIQGIDEDIDTKVILRFSPHAQHRKIHKAQWWYAFGLYAISTIYWALIKDFKQHASYRKRGLHTQSSRENNKILAWLTFTKILYFFTFFGVPLLVGIPFWQTLVGFVVMHMACGLILSLVFQLAHTVEDTQYPLPDAQGNIDDSWAAHQLRTTMNFACSNRWLSWYVGGLNFQVEHHLFTRICHVHYPAIAPIVKQTAQEFGLPYLEKRTFGGAFNSHVRFLKTLGRTPSLDEILD